MQILIADQLSESCIKRLESEKHYVSTQPDLKDEALAIALKELKPQVLVVRSTKVSASILESVQNLELIVRAGAGFDNIDITAASNRGIFVANCPGKNSAAVAELTIGLMLALDRSIPDNVIDSRAGVWNKGKYGASAGIKGKTLGVVGLGSIGLQVISRAKALQMHIVAWSRSLTDERAKSLGITRLDSAVAVAGVSDVVTIHVAGTAETASIAGREFFDAMKPGAFFINTARSSVVDEQAMIDAMHDKGIRVALDVFSQEPTTKDGTLSHGLAERPDVYLTHHIGASTLQAQDEIADEAMRVILTYASTNVVPNCVNISVVSGAHHQLTVRHRNKVGVLASVLNEISEAGWNVQEMHNMVFKNGDAACAVIRFEGRVTDQVLDRIQANSDILAVTVIDL